MNSPDANDPLKPLLAGWRADPPRDPKFRGRVWARIETAESPATWPGFARSHPAAIAGVVAAAAVMGAVSGRELARARIEADSSRLATAYVQQLDARTMTMP